MNVSQKAQGSALALCLAVAQPWCANAATAQRSAAGKLKDGTAVVIRPIQPEDEPLLVKFHETLSEESVYHRYFTQLKLDQRIAHDLPKSSQRMLQGTTGYLATMVAGVATRRNDAETAARPGRLVRSKAEVH